MPDPRISVIIPTRQRADLLRGSLESLANQSLSPDQYEVIVVDDGATDHTGDVCRELMGRMQLKYHRIEHSGISAAKNLGIFTATAPILLFFDDDDYASRTLLAEHLIAHRRYPGEQTAVLGYTRWAPELTVTAVMHYVMDVGRLLFCYTMTQGQNLDFTYFWGGRTSCKRSFLAQHGVFRHELKSILEDIELGYRLSKQGLQVIFHRNAVQYMNRAITYQEFCRRCERQGSAQCVFSRLYRGDPVIEQYCQLPGAEHRWKQMSADFDHKVARVGELESLLGSADKGKGVISELHELYRWTFAAFKTRAVVESIFTANRWNSKGRPACSQNLIPAIRCDQQTSIILRSS